MDEYPQPRPVLYGTWEDEAPVQTQTLPVRSGPPRYPPAPPMAGDAPDPFEPSRPRYSGASSYVSHWPRRRALPFVILLYASYLVISLALTFWNLELFAVLGAIATVVIALASVSWLIKRYLSLRKRRWLSSEKRRAPRVSRPKPDLRGWRNRW